MRVAEALYVAPEKNWLHHDGKLNLKFKDKLHLSEEGYHKFSLYVLKILASAPQSASTYEHAIGEFEASSPPTYSFPSSIISPVPTVSSNSFLFCQDDFPSLSADVGSSSHLILPTPSALSVSTVFTSSCFPPLSCLSSHLSSTLSVPSSSAAASCFAAASPCSAASPSCCDAAASPSCSAAAVAAAS